jgi:Uma2 family endonuclease
MSTAEVEVEAPVVLGPELAGTLMTPEEFDAVEECDELYVYELIHGVLVVNPPPLEVERGPNDELGFLLRLYRYQHPQGAALDETLPEHYVRTPDSRRRADRVIWAGLGRQPDPRRDTPTIAIEFVSAGKRNRRRDYVEKRDEYLAAGVTAYWIFDRFRRTLTVYHRGLPELVISESETYRSPLLPGFEVPLAQLLAVADRWQVGPP